MREHRAVAWFDLRGRRAPQRGHVPRCGAVSGWPSQPSARGRSAEWSTRDGGPPRSACRAHSTRQGRHQRRAPPAGPASCSRPGNGDAERPPEALPGLGGMPRCSPNCTASLSRRRPLSCTGAASPTGVRCGRGAQVTQLFPNGPASRVRASLGSGTNQERMQRSEPER